MDWVSWNPQAIGSAWYRRVGQFQMEESPENSAIERQQQSLQQIPEGEEGEQIIEQPEEGPQISEQLRNKFTKTLQGFSEQMKAFREGQHNSFRIENPHEYELFHIARIWQSRPCRNEKFLLHIELEDPKLSRELVKQIFEALPSIIVIYGGVKIENNSILTTDGEFFYEGTEKLMNIFSEARETDYHGEVMNRMMHGQGVLRNRARRGGFTYKGSFFEGKFHGSGELRTNKNVTYVGEFKDDFKHGHGVEITMKRRRNPNPGESAFIRKSIYNGQFKEGFRCGEGVEETAHSVYRGEWRDGVKCGHGEIEYRNGDKYEGEWFNGQHHGEGMYLEKGNCTYTGTFQEGKYHGHGVMEYENGDKYEGEFERGKKGGQGIYTWADGDYYDGQWKNDSADGQGTSMLGSNFYDGEYKNGKRHGLGELTTEEGDVIKALWENNQIQKKLEVNGEPAEEQPKP